MPSLLSARQRQALRLAWRFIRPYRKQAMAALLALVVTAGITLSMGQGIRLLVDQGFMTQSPHLLNQSIGLFMVLVLGGEITVEKLQASRNAPVTLSVLGPGSLIGEMSLVDGEARSASCTASTHVTCAVLTREALEAMIAEQPATAAKLMTAIASRLAERLRESGQKLQVYARLVLTLQQEIDVLMPTPEKRR